MIKITTSDIARRFSLKVIGLERVVNHLGLCNRNNLQPNTLSYVTSLEFLKTALSKENITVIIVTQELTDYCIGIDKTLIVADYPEDLFYAIFDFIACSKKRVANHPKIGKNCQIHESAIIEDNVIIGDNVRIGAFTIIHSNSVIKKNAVIGSHCAIGSNGFQALKKNDGSSYNVEHIGGVVIGENCYIAEFVNISRGLFDSDVVLEDNVLVDVGCHIAHDCHIGRNSVLTAHTILFGSSSVGESVWMSPGSMLMNRKHISDRCHVAPGSLVMTNTQNGETYIGIPAIKESTFIKREMKLKKLLK